MTLWEALKAIDEGKKVQYRVSLSGKEPWESFDDDLEVTLDVLMDCDFRIVDPLPVIFVNIHEHANGEINYDTYPTFEECMDFLDEESRGPVQRVGVKFQEVIDET